MRSSSWLTIGILGLVLAVGAGTAIAAKGGKGGGKPGGGGEDPVNTTPLDLLLTEPEGSGFGTLYGIQDDGSGLTSLAPDRGGHSWSADGTRIAFYSDGFSDGFGIYVMDLDAGSTELLIPLSDYTAGWLDWCPVAETDGTEKLAFTMRPSSTTGAADVYVAWFDDTGLLDYENVTQTTGGEQALTWSPNGDQLVVDYHNELRVLDLANRDAVTGLPATHVVYESSQISPSYPTWAKTGNRIAFTAYDSADSHPLNDIYLLTVSQNASTGVWAGSTPINLTNSPNDEENGTLAWSPDDSKIACGNAYWRKLGKGSSKWSIDLIDTTTGSRSSLTDRGVHPAWKRVTD